MCDLLDFWGYLYKTENKRSGNTSNYDWDTTLAQEEEGEGTNLANMHSGVALT